MSVRQPIERRNDPDILSLYVRRVSILLRVMVGIVFVAGAISTLFWVELDNAQEDIEAAGKERRHETCRIFERDYAQAVRSLENTYRFLGAADRTQLIEDPVSRFVYADLKNTESRARAKRPPDFCLVDGVGEPDVPVFPKRPDLSHLK